MNGFFAAVRKDTIVCGRALAILFILCPLFIIFINEGSLAQISFFIPLMGLFFLNIADPADALALYALPIPRRSFVAGRYFVCAAIILCSLIVSYGLSVIAGRKSLVSSLIIIAAADFIITGIALPISYALSRNAVLVGVSTLLGILTILVMALAMQGCFSRITVSSHALVAGTIAIGSIAFYGASCVISMHFAERRIL